MTTDVTTPNGEKKKVLSKNATMTSSMVDTRQQTKISAKTSLLVIGLLAAGGLVAAALLVSKPAPQTMTVNKTPEQLQTQFIQAAGKYLMATPAQQPTTLETLRQAAQDRQAAMMKLLPTNPEKFLSLAMAKNDRDHLPADVQILVERETSVAGRLVLRHADDFGQKSIDQYLLISNDAVTAAYFVNPPSDSLLNTEVTIHGFSLGEQLVSAGVPEPTGLTDSAPAAVVGGRKVAVIMVKLADQTIPVGATSSAIRGAVFTDFNSANQYFQENSLGVTPGLSLVGKTGNVDGDVYGWINIPQTSSVCEEATWADAADQLVEAQYGAGTLSGYDNYLYALAGTVSACQWAGLAYFSEGRAWVKTGSTFSSYTFAKVTSHELGHNFQTHHASSRTCTPPDQLGQNCPATEYGDSLDVMGNGYRHMSNYRKGLFGWYSAAQTAADITTSGVKTISPQEIPSGGPKVLRIPRISVNGSPSEYLYLEYRQSYGTFDSALPGTAVNGILVRSAPPYSGGISHSYLYTATAVQVGSTVTDPVNGITIRTDSVSPTNATVTVTLECRNNNPELSISLAQSFYRPGTSVPLSFLERNTDSLWCAGTSQFSLTTSSLPNGWTWQAPPNQTLGPNQDATIGGTLDIPVGTASGSYSVPFILTNLSQPGHSVQVSKTIRIDGQPPVVTITQPVNGSVLPTSGTVTISMNVTDNNGGPETLKTLAIDGATVQTCQPQTLPAPCTYDWAMVGIRSGTHEIISTATDNAGNVGSASIIVVYPGSGDGGIDPSETQ